MVANVPHPRHLERDKPAYYWDVLANTFLQQGRQTVWRHYCDSLFGPLVMEWLRGSQVMRALKTDLFDEAVSQGLVPWLTEFSQEIHGIDISPNVVEAARSRHPTLRTRVADVRGLPYPTGHFDFVLSHSTLDHFSTRQDIARSLKELHRVLQPDGQFLITLDNLSNPIVLLRKLIPFRILNKIGILPYFVGETLTPGGLRSYLRTAGFEIQRVKTVMHAPRAIAILACRILELYSRSNTQARFVSVLKRFEFLAQWPSCHLTGYFAVALARKR